MFSKQHGLQPMTVAIGISVVAHLGILTILGTTLKDGNAPTNHQATAIVRFQQAVPPESTHDGEPPTQLASQSSTASIPAVQPQSTGINDPELRPVSPAVTPSPDESSDPDQAAQPSGQTDVNRPLQPRPSQTQTAHNPLPVSDLVSSSSPVLRAPRKPISPEPTPAIVTPTPDSPIRPDYPFSARRRGVEGEVLVNVVVSDRGFPVSTEVIAGSGDAGLDEAAISAIHDTRFRAGTIDAKPHRMATRIRVRFRLNP